MKRSIFCGRGVVDGFLSRPGACRPCRSDPDDKNVDIPPARHPLARGRGRAKHLQVSIDPLSRPKYMSAARVLFRADMRKKVERHDRRRCLPCSIQIMLISSAYIFKNSFLHGHSLGAHRVHSTDLRADPLWLNPQQPGSGLTTKTTSAVVLSGSGITITKNEWRKDRPGTGCCRRISLPRRAP